MHFTQADAVEHATGAAAAPRSPVARAEGRDRRADRRLPVRRRLRQDAVEAAAQGDRRAPRRDAAALPAAGGAAGPGRAAHGHLRHRHPRRRHQRADPHRAVHRAGEVRRQPAADPADPRVPADRRPGRAGPASTPPATSWCRRPSTSSRTRRPRRSPRPRTPHERGEAAKKQVASRSCSKPPEGTVVWTEQTFDKLVAGVPEPLVSRMRVDNAMLINVAGPRGGRVPGAAPAAHRQPRGPRASSSGWPVARCGWPGRCCAPGSSPGSTSSTSSVAATC